MKIAPQLQRARWSAKAYGGGAHDAIVAAATHALVLTGWQIENDNLLGLADSLSRPNTAARETIGILLAALRLETGISTGYAQELWLARGWASGRPTPQVSAAGVRRYPEWMDHFGWTADETPLVTREQLRNVARTYNSIRQIAGPRLGLALRRLNAAMTRDEPSDSVLDATIALEILLGDDDGQAISWKLRMRAAALAGVTGDHPAMLAARDQLAGC